MGSFKASKRNQGPDRRRGAKNLCPRDLLTFEALEQRTLLDATPIWKATSTNIADVKNGPMANAGADLIGVYQAFQNNGGNGAAVAAQFPNIMFSGNSVRIDIQGNGDFNQFLNTVQNLGMQITGADGPHHIAEGLIPISALLSAATATDTIQLAPVYKPQFSFRGSANNEAEAAIKANTARSQFGVDGTGVTVGVLSDSVSLVQGGLADSVRTGDLPGNVRVLQEGPTAAQGGNASDEGRAMLENVYDIAPGANLAFATADFGQVGFANNIRNLASQANAKIIVDDVGFINEPMFQDGIASQAVSDVVNNNGATYFSAAGNSADHGYSSQFRGTNNAPTGLPAGRYMDFDPGAGVLNLLPITTNAVVSPGDGIVFNFDQPWFTANGVTSDVDIFVLNAQGQIVAQSNNNNIATQQTFEFVDLSGAPANTQLTVAIRVVSGPDPGHVQFIEWGQPLASVSQQFGSAGGTFYPTTFGHPTSADAIGVGAVPWWGNNSTVTPAIPPIKSEPFSSFGPATIFFDSFGNPLTSAGLRLKPDISAPDGGNTSFFPPGQVIDTSNPPFPGQPATPTNLSQNLPSFFGTSSAAPNAAAVAALLKQKDPFATSAQIRGALIASATPLNGAAPGSFNAQGGFGLIDAVKAFSSIGGLSVVSTSPSNGQSLTQAPSQIVVTFNRPVNINTITANNLVFSNVPPGVSASIVGAPVGLDNATTPTQVAFPLSINSPPGLIANGNFTFNVQGNVFATDGTVLSPSAPVTFNLNDTIAPRVINTTVNGRVITVQFSEGIRPSTVIPANFQLIRAGSDGSFGKPSNVNLSTDPRFKISYDPNTDTVTLDYSALNQSQFPSDQYALVVLAGDFGGPGVTDLVGNFLDGEFNGVFPSGDGDLPTPGNPSGRSGFERFTQFFGFKQLLAPLVTSLQLTPATDTGAKGDENTNINNPVFIGQVLADFPGTVAGLTILAQFNSLHGGSFTLAPGGGGRGFVGGFDVVTTTDANGTFTLQAPFLPEGYTTVRIIVVGQPDAPPLPGLSSAFSHSFRVDQSGPAIIAATLPPVGSTPGAPIPRVGSDFSDLSKLSLNVVDVPNPTSGPLATPSQILFSALDAATANNLSNYSLVNLDTGIDFSSFIASATFVPTGLDFVSTPPTRSSPFDPFAGRIDLTFNAGLPSGHYALVAHTSERLGQKVYSGLRDAAGNPLNNTNATGAVDFQLEFTLQGQPTFITNFQAVSSYTGLNSNVVGGPRSFYELPALGQTPRAAAPPTAFVFDFSTELDRNADYSNTIQLIGSADPGSGLSDGDFGTLGEGGLGSTGTTGFSIFPGTTVTLADKTSGARLGQPGFQKGDRLILEVPGGTTLPADHYRIYIPNTGTLAIHDRFGNQLDGEFLGTQTGPGGYETLLPNGQYRNGISGDTVAGGAFVTSFVVVPNGNVIFAKPDYVEDPLLPSTAPDGSLARPYSALAIETNPATAPANPTNDPNGGPNSTSFFFNFNSQFDRNGNGKFDRSALYAAQQLSTRGPVVVVALPGTPTRDPLTGQITQRTFVLQAPAGPSALINDGSASVPFNTTLVFNPGSALKLQNASLYVQNQGSALQALGGANPNDQVNFTSFADSSVGGKTNGPNGKSTPAGGDWGGIVFRNFNNTIGTRNLQFPIDGTLQGFAGAKAVSGADDALSILNFTNIKFAGGTVPQTQGTPASGITLFNSRPTVSNVKVAQAGASSGGVSLIAGISADLDSFREDDTARGPLIRRTTVSQSSLNGILVRPDSSGVVQQSDALIYPDNPATLGGNRNFTFDDPLPHILISQMLVGQQLDVNTGGQTEFVNARLYIQPGMMVKSQVGAGIAVVNNEASMNIGSRTYINEFDADPNVSPSSAGFKVNSATDAKVLFTSIYDNAAFTSFFDPSTQQTTIIVPATDAANSGGVNQPTPGNVPPLARWGSVSVQSGAVASVNRAEFRYGGGIVHGPNFSVPNQSVLAFITTVTPLNTPAGLTFPGAPLTELGTHVMVTNNDFFDNLDAAMQIEPNGLMAGDSLRPLLSGHPFFRNNVMQRNDIDGMAVVSSFAIEVLTQPNQPIRRIELPLAAGNANLTVNSVWDSTDLTYVVRGSIVLAGAYDFNFGVGGPFGFPQDALPDPTAFVAERGPHITLTLQSALPGTLLADGTEIGRPGEGLLVKMFNDYAPLNAGAANLATAFGSIGVNGFVSASTNVGAGFVVGVDDGVDPPANNSVSPVVDPGASSQLRIVGIPGNETTGQPRVPVTITSLRDGSAGKTVRGVNMSNIYNADRLFPNRNLTAPAAGDGGYIYFGSNSLTDYNLLDSRDGNLIDNADIRYLTRIEVQGGGIVDVDNSPPGPGQIPLTFADQKLGQTPKTQFNSQWAMTISNSNLGFFSDAAIFAHANSASTLLRDLTTLGQPTLPGQPPPVFFPARDTQNTQRSQGYTLFLYGNTITNSNVGIEAHSDTVAPQRSTNAENIVLLNNTFYNNPTAFHTVGTGPNTTAQNNHVYWLAMNNIFANSSTVAIKGDGVLNGSQAQFNLFFQNGIDLDLTAANGATFFGNFNAIVGDPDFVDPNNGNFNLGPNSAAIDAARSEIGPLPAGDAIYPTVDQVLDAFGRPTAVSRRTNPATLLFPATPGRSNADGGNVFITDPRKIVDLPGQSFSNRGFFDQWVPTLVSDPDGVAGPTSNINTYNYKPLLGVRDANGFLRQDDPNSPNVGFGANPFYDIGAFEHREFNPPKVTGVTATITNPASQTGVTTFNLYATGNNRATTNQTPQTIQVQLNHSLDLATVTNHSVLLQGSGGDGLFGNANSPNDRFYDLSGKLDFNPVTSILTIHLGDQGLTLPSDIYRIQLLGNGSDVLRDAEGNALDGENLDANGLQTPLPSGDNTPGGNFFLTFTVNTESASLVNGSFVLSQGSDTNARDFITSDNRPIFSGSVTVQTPLINPLAGQIIVIDVSTKGDGVFDRMNAGTAVTDAQGNFQVQVGVDGANTGLVTNTGALPDSPYNVGFDGLLNSIVNSTLLPNGRSTDDVNYSIARVRIINSTGITLPGNTTSFTGFAVDTQSPKVTGISPAQGALLTQDSSGRRHISFTVDKNLDPASLNAGSILLTGAGPDGAFGTADDVPVTIDPTIKITPLLNGPKGPERVDITVSGSLANDQYLLTLKGTGSPITDVAGNALNSGADFFTFFVAFSPGSSHTIFVGAPSFVTDPTAAQGSRNNPFSTITAGLGAAVGGDVVAVLPGVYTENVSMKSLVKLESADISSTDGNVVRGSALQTIIRGPSFGTGTTVSAVGLFSLNGLDTEITGFTIASPLLGDPALGFLDLSSVGLRINNSNILVDRNYFVDSGFGIAVETSGDAAVPRIFENGVIGNATGILLNDTGTTVLPKGVFTQITNNTFAFNTFGVLAMVTSESPILGRMSNNIFWQNHDLTVGRSGAAIYATVTNKLIARNNMFSGNGPTNGGNKYAGIHVGNGFDPLKLKSTPDSLGNFVGDPAFVSPRDPRPGADGPASFFVDANFDLKSTSKAIDNANNALAPSTDFLARSRVNIPNVGFKGLGPADVGAFEFQGGGGVAVGGSFRVVTTSVSPTGAARANGATLNAGPKSITVDFSRTVDRRSVAPTDLVLSGTTAKATSLTWIDNHTVRFNLSAGIKAGSTVRVTVPSGAVTSGGTTKVQGFSDTFKVAGIKAQTIQTSTPVAPKTLFPVLTPTPTSTPTLATYTPPPAAAPTKTAKPKGILALFTKKKP